MGTAAKTERFELRLDPGILDDVDAWRGRQADFPSRAEAVRRLIEAGMAEPKGSEIRFSDDGKLILDVVRPFQASESQKRHRSETS